MVVMMVVLVMLPVIMEDVKDNGDGVVFVVVNVS